MEELPEHKQDWRGVLVMGRGEGEWGLCTIRSRPSEYGGVLFLKLELALFYIDVEQHS